ncbi:MAG: oligoribonuclease [Gammaproteobacteria bacterium]|nr:oligoribonuclease [Gammaproteobacteria bacterium]
MSAKYTKPPRLVWIDLEMTGLDVENDVILEVATIITDNDLNIIEESDSMVIHQPESVLETMNDWSRKHHAESGLLDRVRESEITVEEAEATTYDLVRTHVEIHTSPLCGNSVWQDRRFLARYMPTLEHYLHYRLIDVSTVKELARRWAPSLLDQVAKQAQHRALDDIRESINELKLYREHFLKTSRSTRAE